MLRVAELCSRESEHSAAVGVLRLALEEKSTTDKISGRAAEVIDKYDVHEHDQWRLLVVERLLQGGAST